MKLTHREKIGQHGEVRIPEDYRKDMGLHPGEEVEFRREGHGLLIERVREAVACKGKGQRSAVGGLTGLIPVGDPKLIDKLLASDDLCD